MSAIVFVQKHPFYTVTAEDGRFIFKNLPAGNYQLSVWHEGLGSANKIVSDTRHEAQIVFSGPKRRA